MSILGIVTAVCVGSAVRAPSYSRVEKAPLVCTETTRLGIRVKQMLPDVGQEFPAPGGAREPTRGTMVLTAAEKQPPGRTWPIYKSRFGPQLWRELSLSGGKQR